MTNQDQPNNSIVPLISIITPLYNKERYISDTINSVIAQSYHNWEMLIIDDGSTDKSPQLVDDLAKNDTRIKYLNRTDFKQNKGASVCRNIGIQKAKGHYILFLDADDVLADFCLEKRMQSIKSSNADVYVFKVGYFKNKTIMKETFNHKIKEFIIYGLENNRERFIKCFLSYYLPFTISDLLWKKDALIQVGGFTEDFQRLQDPELHTRLFLDESIKFDLFRKTLPDIWIRVDEDRRDFDNESHYLRHKTSVLHFVEFFNQYLKSQNKAYYFQCTKNYYFSIYQTALYYFGGKRASEEFVKIYPFKLGFWTKVLLVSGNIKILKKLKVPSLIINTIKLKHVIF